MLENKKGVQARVSHLANLRRQLSTPAKPGTVFFMHTTNELEDAQDAQEKLKHNIADAEIDMLAYVQAVLSGVCVLISTLCLMSLSHLLPLTILHLRRALALALQARPQRHLVLTCPSPWSMKQLSEASLATSTSSEQRTSKLCTLSKGLHACFLLPRSHASPFTTCADSLRRS